VRRASCIWTLRLHPHVQGRFGSAIRLTVATCSGEWRRRPLRAADSCMDAPLPQPRAGLAAIGHYTLAGSTIATQTPCPAGRYGSTTVSAHAVDSPPPPPATPHPAMHHLAQGLSTSLCTAACAANSFSNAGASVCTSCSVGSYCAGGLATLCPAGRYGATAVSRGCVDGGQSQTQLPAPNPWRPLPRCAGNHAVHVHRQVVWG
jgi:hypothetical protein